MTHTMITRITLLTLSLNVLAAITPLNNVGIVSICICIQAFMLTALLTKKQRRSSVPHGFVSVTTHVPASVHALLKVYAKKHDTSLKALLRSMIEELVGNYEQSTRELRFIDPDAKPVTRSRAKDDVSCKALAKDEADEILEAKGMPHFNSLLMPPTTLR